MFWTYFQWLFFWASFLVFPWLVFNLLMLWRLHRRARRADPAKRGIFLPPLIWWLLLLLSLGFFYMRFVEPYWIVTRQEQFVSGEGTTRIRLAIASDLHLGVFKDGDYLQRVLDVIKTGEPDLLLIPGDLINDPSAQQLKSLFEPFRDLDMPVYAVTGNHDAKVPGHFSSAEVRAVLPSTVTTIDNGEADFIKDGRVLHLIGISDLMEGDSSYDGLTAARPGQFNLVLTHNPDSAYELPEELYPTGGGPDLLLAGHTHGGQMFIPPLVYWMIPCEHLFLRGWYEVKGVPVYVTSGLGEVLLPMRFLVPPEVIFLDLYI
jgi:hypothetical protein